MIEHRYPFEKSFMRTVAFWLSLIVIFMIAWEDMISIGDLGTRGTMIGGLFLAASWVAAVVITGRFRKPHPFHLMVYLFVLWNTVSAFWSFDIEGTVARTVTYFQLTALVWIIWDLYRTPADLRAGLQAYVLGSYVALGSAVANYFTGNTYTSSRISATGFNPNNLGLMLALGIPVAWHLAISENHSTRTRLLKLVNYAYVPAATLGILLGASRGALVSTLPAFFFVLGSLPRLKLLSRGLILVALITSLFAVQTLVPQASSQRLSTTGTSIAEGDLNTRTYIWRAGLAVFSAHPLLGVGSGAFRTAVGVGKVAHNVFVSVLVEVGIVGFALFAAILAITVVRAIRQPKWDSRFWLAVLLVWALGASVHTWEQKKPTWLFLSLAVASAGVSLPSHVSRLRTDPIWQREHRPDWVYKAQTQFAGANQADTGNHCKDVLTYTSETDFSSSHSHE
jgi:O-antigen ligase